MWLARLALFACCACGAPPPSPPLLREPGWTEANRARLERFLRSLEGRRGRLVAVFDWDNTMMKGDIGDALFEHLLVRSSIRVDLASTSAHFTEEARAAIAEACVPDRGDRCRALLRSIYERARTLEDRPAFEPERTDAFHAPYAWLSQLLAGHTPEEVRAMARAAFEEAGLRLYEPMRELVTRLRERRVEVFVVSASPQQAVEPVAELAGIDAAHVIGIRQPLDGERLGLGFAPCGGTEPVMTYDRGKRCFVNQVIFGVDRIEPQPSDRRPLFAAGDSDTDRAMLEDASELALLIDRRHPGVSCDARARGYLVQPMFIEPLPPREPECP